MSGLHFLDKYDILDIENQLQVLEFTHMKRILTLLMIIALNLALFGCGTDPSAAQIAATTLPVYEFTARLCQGSDIRVTRLVTESVSCLHDYTLQVNQMRAIENSQIVVISGVGLEDFLADALTSANTVIDASTDIPLLCYEEHHDHDHTHEHSHEHDPHIWLSPANAKIMVSNIYKGLIVAYPEYTQIFSQNLSALESEIDKLDAYANKQLKELSSREIITFHDGFSYMADAFNLEIVHAIEEESGSEASAAELIQLSKIVSAYQLNAIFTEENGSSSAAEAIAAETGASLFQLDMAMSGDSYFESMYHNIDTLKEALE